MQQLKISFIGIDHPALAADDVESLSTWYCDVLGYQKWFYHDKPVWMLKAPDGTLLEIMPKDDTPRPVRTTWTPGWSHLALRVDNIDESIFYLDSKGITWAGALTEAIGGGKVRSFFDPEGNMVQIVQRFL